MTTPTAFVLVLFLWNTGGDDLAQNLKIVALDEFMYSDQEQCERIGKKLASLYTPQMNVQFTYKCKEIDPRQG